ncbi:cytochrome P450 [Nocardiopsis sediminis]|uniref:Cytochrome P450 n=1 Tax=Nocardiopsis sediminis TaxID=1778267 RepID=A0ABV8FHT1_9ACTN
MDDLIERLLRGRDDPWPLYDRLRESGTGVHFYAGIGARGAYLCFRHADITRIHHSPETFGAGDFRSASAAVHDPADPEERRFVDIWSRQAVFRDGAGHQRLRRALKTAFTGAAAERIPGCVEHASDDVIARLFLRGRSEIEFMREVAAEVPIAVSARVLGIDPADRDRFRSWCQALLHTTDARPCPVSGSPRPPRIAPANELVDHLRAALHARRRAPGPDLISALARSPEFAPAHADGDAEILAQIVLILAAGNDATANLLGNAVNLLLDMPGLRTRLAEEPGRIGAAVEEVLRYAPPVHMTCRVALRDVELGGHAVRRGTPVIQAIPAANRDPRVFAEPHVFRIDRFTRGDAPAHVSFAPGRHHCIGDHLARMQAQVMLARFLAHFPRITRGSLPALPQADGAHARGWKTLPVRLRP